ncbi:maltodextrin glucosidase [Endozoicomonas elysicola]|uniref:Maltodextrin glucosidase n=1 Tax=Endozoicomonas elysicola TaxID=305900 RepID=A0A081K6E3_9GAMM|nr:maltodextrin glucosidase [Endozoicomonas elysicola]KEI69719.1 maltodextrin glucosidase [Endozoicomonas elysicola]
MKAPFIYHGQDHRWVKVSGTTLTVHVVTEQSFQPDALYVRCEPDNEERLIPMDTSGNTGRLKIWKATFPLNQDKATTVYCFKAVTTEGQWWLDGTGIFRRMPGQEKLFRYNSEYQPPEWVKHQIFYQIFPDRFANGNPDVSVQSGEYCLFGDQKPTVAKDWGAPVSEHGKDGACEFFGGDIQGICEKLDYLQSLGVSTLYLNPIFSAPSNHKYDTTDYLNIDPHLGTNEKFAELVENLHTRGMKIVLDAVFNHTSLDHPWFDRFSTRNDSQGAWKNTKSPYRDYYQFDGDSDNYVGWNGIHTLPKLNFLNQEVRSYFYDSDASVIKHWLREPYKIDGWRFDVIHMLGEGEGATNNAHYVQAFRQSAKAENPQCYVLGEHFFEATQWLQGDQEDGAMNYYGFAHPVRAFFANLDIAFAPCRIEADEFASWLMEAMAKIPWRNQLSQLNQLDSHDTMRFLSMVNGDEATFRSALMLLFCWAGVPCIYYGTEVALEGGHDPDNRRCFPWERLESRQDMVSFIKTLTALRSQTPALQSGSVQWLYAQGDVFTFVRCLDNERVICAINRGDNPEAITLPIWKTGLNQGHFSFLMEGESIDAVNGELVLNLPGKTGKILIQSL